MAKFRFSTRELGRRIQEAARANGAALFPSPAEAPPGSPALLRLMRSV